MTARAKIRCVECDTWHTTEDETNVLECECGSRIAVTITVIDGPRLSTPNRS